MDTDLRWRITKEISCPWCTADKGKVCRTKAGKRCTVLHRRRVDAWWKKQEETHGTDYLRKAIHF